MTTNQLRTGKSTYYQCWPNVNYNERLQFTGQFVMVNFNIFNSNYVNFCILTQALSIRTVFGLGNIGELSHRCSSQHLQSVSVSGEREPSPRDLLHTSETFAYCCCPFEGSENLAFGKAQNDTKVRRPRSHLFSSWKKNVSWHFRQLFPCRQTLVLEKRPIVISRWVKRRLGP